MSPVFLIDISSYLHRAMHVVHGKLASEADPSDISFTVHAANMLANTMFRLHIERMAVVFDSTEPSARCQVYPQYKADRKPHTPVFAAQMPRFMAALANVGVSVFEEPTFEADDIIATLVGDEKVPYSIVSHDKDLLALVDDASEVAVYNPTSDKWHRMDDIFSKLGVFPWQLHDYMGLVGDASDGIPGVPGIGAKTASALVAKYETLERIYSAECRELVEDDLSKKQFSSLVESEEVAFLSRRLAKPIICPELIMVGHGPLSAPSPDRIRTAAQDYERKR